MKDFLQDLVSHTFVLGDITLVKILCNNDNVVISSSNEDRTVIINAITHTAIDDLFGSFAMPNLNRLDTLLKCPEYKNAIITITHELRQDKKIPVGLHFKNETNDYQNDYRFMSIELADEKQETLELLNTKWNVDITPSISSIQRLKYQSQANPKENTFQIRTENSNLIFSFGDAATHAGEFIFEFDVTGTLKHALSWPISETLSILNLVGDKKLKISNNGAMQITVDSGLALYNYTLPAQS